MKRALALIEQQKAKQGDINQENDTDKGNMPPRQQRRPSASKVQQNDDKVKLMAGNDSGISSRKSTAVSSTSRIGSSGTGSHKTGRPAIDFLSERETKPLYELSIKNKQKKPPHKLKPLASAMATAKLQNLTNEFDTFAERQLLRDIDEEMNEYINPNQILNQMESAFGGSSSTSYRPSQTTKINKKNSNNNSASLDPILEETNLNSLQLVTYAPDSNSLAEQRARKNELLKKRVKQITQGASGSNVQGDDTNTFLTSCKTKEEEKADMQLVIANNTEDQDSLINKKYYKYPEDELLDEMDQHERDMNDMLKYLTECEDLMKGQDLQSIQSMMDVTKEGMTQHFEAYDKLKDQITSLGEQADMAIESLNFYEKNKQTYDKGANNYRQALAKVDEDPDYEAEEVKKNGKASHENSKKGIVNKLVNMNQSMREFTVDLESRLDKAYKSGAGKKYGYDSVSNMAKTSGTDAGDDKKNKKEDRNLNKLASQAQTFLDQHGSAASILGVGSFSNQGKKTSNIKALTAKNEGVIKKTQSKTVKGNNDDIKSLQY